MIKGKLSEKPSEQNAMINEINSAPSPDVSYYADLETSTIPTELEGAKKILKAIFK